MIRLTRISGIGFILNAELVQEIEETPDTIITLTCGKKLMVKESVDEVMTAVLHYRQSIHSGPSPEKRNSE
jgi:flagellar protein FlbD